MSGIASSTTSSRAVNIALLWESIEVPEKE
jgi:hypothetical protein